MTSTKDSLGDRMKGYEAVYDHYLVKRIPVLVRVDGKAFHTYTCHFAKPFSAVFVEAMRYATVKLAQEMQGFKMAYVQSDEAQFLITDFDQLTTQGWLDYRVSKIVSHSASIFTAHFNHYMLNLQNSEKVEHYGFFDARCFNVPLEDVPNAFLWRMKDWERNSVQMYARSFYSHKELHGKGIPAMHEMLHTKGKNWATDLTLVQKNGSLFVRISEQHVDECITWNSNYACIQSLMPIFPAKE